MTDSNVGNTLPATGVAPWPDPMEQRRRAIAERLSKEDRLPPFGERLYLITWPKAGVSDE